MRAKTPYNTSNSEKYKNTIYSLLNLNVVKTKRCTCQHQLVLAKIKCHKRVKQIPEKALPQNFATFFWQFKITTKLLQQKRISHPCNCRKKCCGIYDNWICSNLTFGEIESI